MGRVAGNNLAVEGRPVVDAIDLRGGDVTNDPDALTNVLGGLELLNEPLHFTVRIVLSSMTIKIKVRGVAKVGVERDDAKSRGRVGGVGSIDLERLDSVASEPSSPVIRQGVV